MYKVVADWCVVYAFMRSGGGDAFRNKVRS